jgi:hypothetical protein
MAISMASTARGYLALLRAFVAQLEEDDATRKVALRSLVAPEVSDTHFASVLEHASASESGCLGGVVAGG